MTAQEIIATALMLGGFVAAAGAYGILYCAARMWNRPALWTAGKVCCAAMIALAAAIVVLSPLLAGWKLLVAASCAAYVAIPPVTWRYLTRLHRGERTSDDAGPA